MRRLTINSLLALMLGLGLTLALVWVLVPTPVEGLSEREQPTPTPPRAPAGVLTVCPDGSCAYDSIQAAVDAARTGDEIRVAGGHYTGVSARAGVTQVVYVSKTVTIRGGYTTTNWVTPDPDANPTILDAQGQGRVLYVTGPSTGSGQAPSTGSGQAPSTGSGRAPSAGGSPRHRSGQATGSPQASGQEISPVIEGLCITGGEASIGGGVYVEAAAATISGCQVFSNTANQGGYGGGLYLDNDGAELTGNVVVANTAIYGGGVYAYRSDSVMRENTVISNTAEDGGGGVCLYESTSTLLENTVAGNTANVRGGGVFVFGDGPTLADNALSNNTADWGGGIYLFASETTLSQNDVAANVGRNGGGGLCTVGATARLNGDIFRANSAGKNGGGLYFHTSDVEMVNNVVIHNRAPNAGSGFFIYKETSARLLHTTLARNGSTELTTGGSTELTTGGSTELTTGGSTGIASNESADGRGIYVDVDFDAGTVALTNTILVGHRAGIYVDKGTKVSLESTLWGAGPWANEDDWSGPGLIITGTPAANVWGDPAFVNPDAADYHLKLSSAAIDRGHQVEVDCDIDGHPRPIGAGYDLGADEQTGLDFSASRHIARPTWAGPGDVLTYTITLRNSGPMTAANTVLFSKVPSQTTYISGSLRASSGTVNDADGIRWTGTVTPNYSVTVTYSVTVNKLAFIENTAWVTDQYGAITVLRAWVNASRFYFPLILQAFEGSGP